MRLHLVVSVSHVCVLAAREFFLFGSPIQKSPSPSMHNAAFQAKGLPFFTYGLHDTTDIADVVKRMQEPDTAFGGGSVTIPHKVDVMSYLDELTPAAKAIGAVNTVIREDRFDGVVRWKGDNTDWLGILRPITKRLAGLARQEKDRKELVALVVGAGGTSMAASYAMRQLGVGQLFIYNRTLAKAEEVAQRFQAHALSSLTPESLASVDVVVSTIPAQAGFVLPDYLVQQAHKVVVLDAAYQPPITPFLAHASSNGASCIQGYEMLYEQAIEQYNRWHKITHVESLDESVMKDACLQHIPSDQRL